ncbi:MAG TPA: alpha-1-antitrypsin [Planctomycetaceae bacterium]|nr:alpha-1-antitrypsin [Planctomycetaceae bacterium]
MSLLAPLYILGALAVAAPVIFHLIRRQVKQRTPLSTMMFLPNTQPKLSRRSRLENLPLLLLRALALLLLALAFSRPFLRNSATTDVDAASRRIVVMVDTSASMRRGDLWNQAIEQLRDVTSTLQPGDSLAIVTFDSQPRLRLGFDAAAEMSVESRRTAGDPIFSSEQPTWNSTDLGAALRFVADLSTGDERTQGTTEAVEVSAAGTGDEATAVQAGSAVETQVVLISDMQAGTSLDALQGIAWPKRLPVEVRSVIAKEKTNAWLTLPAQQEEIVGAAPRESASERDDRQFRLRVSNAQQSQRSQFRLAWIDPSKPIDAKAGLTVEVPPGQSRIVRVEQPPTGATAIELFGDDQDFDNKRYYASEPPRDQTLMFVGNDIAEPRDSLFYYLQRLSLDTPKRRVSIRLMADSVPASIDAGDVPMLIVSGEINDEAAETYKQYVQSGGSLLYVVPSASGNDVGQKSLRRLTRSQEWTIGEAEVKDYTMLSQIDFSHPLFAPFADPKFNDFSKIRFWTHRSFVQRPDGWDVLASFEGGSPAILERLESEPTSNKTGRIWLLAVGWQPLESQLALSTKFIPLIFGMFDASDNNPNSGIQTSLHPGTAVSALVGTDQKLPEVYQLSTEAAKTADEVAGKLIEASIIDQPGVYQLVSDGRQEKIAINIAESESQTDPIGSDELERMGVVVGKAIAPVDAAIGERQLRDVELESQQRIWRWLLIGVLGLLAVETLVGGWIGRQRRPATSS